MTELASRSITFCIVGAHAQLREVLQSDGLADRTDSGDWMRTLDSVLSDRMSGMRTDGARRSHALCSLRVRASRVAA